MKRVFVTGAAGFCGTHLCQYLIDSGYEVIGSYHRGSLPARKKHRYVALDVCDPESVDAAIEKSRPDYICHLAAQSVPRFAWAMPGKTMELNAGGTIFLLDAIRKFVPASRFLHISSIQVYGRSFAAGKPVKETDLLWPLDPYGASKMVSEFACLEFAGRFGLDVVIARAFNHAGLGQPTHFAFPDWCRQIARIEAGKKKTPVLEVGNLNNRRDFLHISDVARAYEILMRKGKTRTAYNVASGNLYSLDECVEFLIKKSRVAIKVKVSSTRARATKNILPVMAGDATRLRALGWLPQKTIFDALEELLDDWRMKPETC